MKKLFVLISLVAFFGVLTAPAFANYNSNPVVVNQEKPKVKDSECKDKTSKDCNLPCTDKEKAACDKEKK